MSGLNNQQIAVKRTALETRHFVGNFVTSRFRASLLLLKIYHLLLKQLYLVYEQIGDVTEGMSMVNGMHARKITPRRLSENEIFFSRSRKAEIITTGIHCSISRIIICA